jgi:hypothetical protein
MSDKRNWRTRLEEAAQRLEATRSAPAWLALAVRDSLSVADALAPRAAKDAAPDDFFYPH